MRPRVFAIGLAGSSALGVQIAQLADGRSVARAALGFVITWLVLGLVLLAAVAALQRRSGG